MTLKSKPCFCKKVLCWSALLLSLHKKFFLLCYIFYPFRLFEVEVISMTVIKNWELLPLKKKKYIFFISKFIDWTKERQVKVYEKEISIEFSLQCTMNIFGFKSGPLKNRCKVFFIFPKLLLFDDFSELCCIFGTLHFEKSSNNAIFFQKMKKNLPIIILLKWPLLEPKIFTVQCCLYLVVNFVYCKI